MTTRVTASATATAACLACAIVFAPGVAIADEPAGGAAPSTAPAPATTPGGAPLGAGDVDLDKDTKPSAALGGDVAGPPPEAPPLPPYKNTLVLDTSIGALAFLGQFGKVAPPAVWLHTQLGYEFTKWVMVYGEGELAFTDTSNAQDPPKTRAFPIFGFGGGARFTARFTDRFGMYLQGGLGLMKADIKTRALRIIGYGDAEDLGLYFGGRLGIEWYMPDRHFALGVTGGPRLATGFQRVAGGSDTPLMIDVGASLRYAF